MKKVFACLLGLILLITAFPFAVSSIEAIPTLSGETSRTTQEITLTDGTKTGVKYTNIFLSGYYGDNREVNVAEADLSNQNLSVEVINCGTYLTSSRTVYNAANEYNAAHEGQTVLAAVNGDFWMTSIHSNSSVAKSVLCVPRGTLIIDGEIWSTSQIDQENICATNIEKGTSAGDRHAFGVTYENQPLVGIPKFNITLDIAGETIEADGINRIPATDSIIVYNNRVSSSNYALDDSYEVVITADETSGFTVGGSVSGTITEIYEPNSATRPSLSNSGTIVLTARGSRLEELRELCALGKKVTITNELTDKNGHTDLWQNVEDAVGGQMCVLYDDEGIGFADTSAYPTTLIGYKDDGTVSLITVTSTIDKSRAGLRFHQAYEFCRDMGYNSVFYLDGGGSATFVSLEDGTYTLRNQCSDGSARSVRSAVAIVWNDEPVVKRQGQLNYIKVLPERSELSPLHLDGAMLYDLVKNPNYVDLAYDSETNVFEMKVNKDTNDPFATLDYTSLSRVNAADYPYIVFKVRTNQSSTTPFALYYACGSDTGASGERVISQSVRAGDEWRYVTFNMAGETGWSGVLNNIRLDIFNTDCSAGDAMYFESVTLCRTAEEAAAVKSGFIPEGSCANYPELLESLKPTPYYVNGDVNCDGALNMADIFAMKKIILGQADASEESTWAADVDGSGAVNLSDCFDLRYKIVAGTWRGFDY